MNEIVDKVIEFYGGAEKASTRFGYSNSMGVYHWKKRGIPTHLLVSIHNDTGIALDILQLATKKKRKVV